LYNILKIFLRYKLCAVERFLGYEYLLNEPSHPLIPAKATTATPSYSKPGKIYS